MFTLPQLNQHLPYFCARSLTVTSPSLTGPSLPLFDFVAFNFDPFTLLPRSPSLFINRLRPGHMRLWLIQPWHWTLIFILARCFPWPLTSRGSSLQPSGPPPPPPGPYLHPSDGPDGLLSAQDIYGITLLSKQRGSTRLCKVWAAALTTELFFWLCLNVFHQALNQQALYCSKALFYLNIILSL